MLLYSSESEKYDEEKIAFISQLKSRIRPLSVTPMFCLVVYLVGFIVTYIF